MTEGLPRTRCVRRAFPTARADGDFGDWTEIERVNLLEAVSGGAPKQGTSVRTAWSDNEWRIFFECNDQDPWATMTERDAPLFKEETVEVFFDPVGDLEGYFEIETNPLGALLDIVFRKSRSGYKGDWAWNCEGLRAAVQTFNGGWSAELAIPFASVAEPPVAGTEWRVNFCRIDRPSRDGALPRELSAWSAPMRESFHTPERFGVMEFVA
jgi:hypothetical protein